MEGSDGRERWKGAMKGIELNLYLQSQRVAATRDVGWEHGAMCFGLLQGILCYRISPKSFHLARDYFEWKRSMLVLGLLGNHSSERHIIWGRNSRQQGCT
jgi:hypothetical protein